MEKYKINRQKYLAWINGKIQTWFPKFHILNVPVQVEVLADIKYEKQEVKRSEFELFAKQKNTW